MPEIMEFRKKVEFLCSIQKPAINATEFARTVLKIPKEDKNVLNRALGRWKWGNSGETYTADVPREDLARIFDLYGVAPEMFEDFKTIAEFEKGYYQVKPAASTFDDLLALARAETSDQSKSIAVKKEVQTTRGLFDPLDQKQNQRHFKVGDGIRIVVKGPTGNCVFLMSRDSEGWTYWTTELGEIAKINRYGDCYYPNDASAESGQNGKAGYSSPRAHPFGLQPPPGRISLAAIVTKDQDLERVHDLLNSRLPSQRDQGRAILVNRLLNKPKEYSLVVDMITVLPE